MKKMELLKRVFDDAQKEETYEPIPISDYGPEKPTQYRHVFIDFKDWEEKNKHLLKKIDRELLLNFAIWLTTQDLGKAIITLVDEYQEQVLVGENVKSR